VGSPVLSSGAMMVRTPALTESFLALRMPKTQEQVCLRKCGGAPPGLMHAWCRAALLRLSAPVLVQVNHMVTQLLNNTSNSTSPHSSRQLVKRRQVRHPNTASVRCPLGVAPLLPCAQNYELPAHAAS